MSTLRLVLTTMGIPLVAACAADDGGESPAVGTTTVVSVGAVADSSSTWVTRYVVGPAGNQVRYRVREQLAGFDLPNDAVGKSGAISGAIAFDADGGLLPAESRFVVDAATFVSDRDRRDRYVTGRLLTATEFPQVVLVPTEVRGVTLPLADGQARSFEVAGDLTVRNVTRPTVWRVTATPQGTGVSGTASTRFVFEDCSMEKPRVRSVLSVADTIALEYDFSLVREDNKANEN